MKLEPTEDDIKHFKASEKSRPIEPKIKDRIVIERAIVRKLCELVIAKGCTVSINDGEDWPVKRSRDMAEIMHNICACDEETIKIRDKNDMAVGSVWLVYGNDGWDVISDYHTSLDTDPAVTGVMDEVNAYANSLSD